MTRVLYGATTDVGAVREINEDSVLAEWPIFVVADGMGGHAAGEVASALAIEQFQGLCGRDDVHAEDVIAAITNANAAIVACCAQRAETSGMGTTVSGVCLGEVGGTPHWFIFNVGDSRVYRFIERSLKQVTIDHSEVEEMIQAGQLTLETAKSYPRRNVITRSLGTSPPPVPDMWVVPALPGDCFLICSDGLTLEVGEQNMAAVLNQDLDPRDGARALVKMALAAGARDNVSVIVVRLPAASLSSELDVTTAPRSQALGKDR